MGGGAVVGSDSELTDNVRTLVLVGRTGDGKSSTGNSILGRKAFKSKAGSGSVTSASELHSTVTENGSTINVIDTPGLFDFSKDGVIGNEIAKCVKLGKDGIHAVLVVLSVRNRFSQEAEAVIKSLRKIFGTRICDYMILVYTAGDDLEEDGETLDDYLSHDCPGSLKETLSMCENRCVLFDNRTKDPCKKSYQVNELFILVDKVMLKNNGKPYTNELFLEMQNETLKRDQQEQKAYEDQLKKIAEMIESALRETTNEKVVRLEAEVAAAKEEIKKLREQLERLTETKGGQKNSDKGDEQRKKEPQNLWDHLDRAVNETIKELHNNSKKCAIM